MSTFSEDVIKLFEEFKKQTGKYQDLDLEKVEFEEKELKDIADKIKAGGTPKTSEKQYWADDFSLIDNQEYFGWRDINKELFSNMYIDKVAKVITKKGLEESSTWLVPEGSILLAIASNSKGLLTINKVPMCINQNILGIVLDKSKYDVRYVYFFLKNHYSKIIQKGFGNLTKTSESKVKILIPKPIGKYSSYEIQKAIAEFIGFISLRSDNIVNLMEEIIRKAERGKENLICKIFEKLPNRKIGNDVIKLFNEFKIQIGKYQDLSLKDIEFEDVYIFKEMENKLISVPSLNLKHNEVKEKESEYKYRKNKPKLDFYPVYSASSNPIGYLPEEFKPDKIIESNPDNPDISFATDGNASAGTNFIIHQGKYYINNTRKVIKFDTNDKSFYTKYLYYALYDMKKKYNFNRNHKATYENLRAIIIPIPKPFANYTSYQIQKIIAEFIEFTFENYLKLIQKIKKESDLLEKYLIRKFF